MFGNMCTFGLSRRSQIDFHEQVLALCGRNISDCPSGQHVPEEALIWNWLGIFLNKELHLLGKWITQRPPYLKCLSIYIKNLMDICLKRRNFILSNVKSVWQLTFDWYGLSYYWSCGFHQGYHWTIWPCFEKLCPCMIICQSHHVVLNRGNIFSNATLFSHW